MQLELFSKEVFSAPNRCGVDRLGLEFDPCFFLSMAFDPPLVVGYMDAWRCYFPLVEVRDASVVPWNGQ